jgi:hypothetical protein
MHTMQRRLSTRLPWLTVLVIVALACLVLCTLSLTVGPMLPWPVGPLLPWPVREYSRLDVLRTSAVPENDFPPFAATVTDAPKINRLLAAIEALPAFSAGTVFCPLGLDTYDHLAFHSTMSLVLQVDIDTAGCNEVYFNGTRHPPQKSAGSPDFWQLFAQTVGVPVSTLQFTLPPGFPDSPYTGPPAPTPSS